MIIGVENNFPIGCFLLIVCRPRMALAEYLLGDVTVGSRFVAICCHLVFYARVLVYAICCFGFVRNFIGFVEILAKLQLETFGAVIGDAVIAKWRPVADFRPSLRIDGDFDHFHRFCDQLLVFAEKVRQQCFALSDGVFVVIVFDFPCDRLVFRVIGSRAFFQGLAARYGDRCTRIYCALVRRKRRCVRVLGRFPIYDFCFEDDTVSLINRTEINRECTAVDVCHFVSLNNAAVQLHIQLVNSDRAINK